ncbi:YpdA family putative bacillithiol disulfide reductase [Candidatus Palauibacter soopunensis]|uniref:YpdA family putative bacillithiol disulfide reductase n=1 Tax=Candidatus Palauibacter soopunensis TaxID=3056739 RepID=UPI00239CFC17|nr:YpdA family putative bacillithiol disulfide reductase [Candidatus Palauibacter soopunensis]MDE2877902.1 YpdA family putative bacillithiol disulfide reductase [Candidatus Palauibacter soopunensis]
MPDSIAETEPLDAIIVGAGPCGLAVAVAVKERGLRYAILDRGCITESLTRYPSYMTFFSTAERLEIGDVPFTIPEPKPTRRDALAYYRHVVAHHGIGVRQYEEVTGIEPVARAFAVHTRTRDGREDCLASRTVVVATGGFGEPNRLGFEGEDRYRRVIHYYREPFPFFDQDVLVVGGGNSAVEAALELYRNGVRVRMVHFADTLDPGVKPWVRPDIENRIASGEIPMHWESRVACLGTGTATIVEESTGAETGVSNDWVLAMTGWRPDAALLTGLGVETDPDSGIPAHDPETMETTVPRVYIAGVIAAGFNANKIFIENGREHGAIIAAHLAARLGESGR